MSKIVLEDFNEGDGYYKVNLAYLSKEQVEEIEDLVSKWNPTDEDIKSCIGMALTDVPETRFKSYGVSLKECLAWLEKQSGQKPFDYENANIQQNDFAPKFKLGDWIVWKDKCYKVNDNGCGYELIDTNGLSTSLEYETVDENAHLWNIQDAKNGDVLLSRHKQPFIYNGIFDNESIGAYCGISSLGHYFLKATFPCNWSYKEGVTPATKEQRNQLEKAMTDDGYKWDAEKKELRKIENSPVLSNSLNIGKDSKWSDEDEELLQHCCGAVAAADYYTLEDKEEMETWLKSLKKKMEE